MSTTDIIQEKILDICAAGRIKLYKRDNSINWLNEKELHPMRYINGVTYAYLGTEHGVGIYQEI